MTCSNASCWARSAAESRGCPCPSALHHQLEIASRTSRPSSRRSRTPRAPVTTSGGNTGSHASGCRDARTPPGRGRRGPDPPARMPRLTTSMESRQDRRCRRSPRADLRASRGPSDGGRRPSRSPVCASLRCSGVSTCADATMPCVTSAEILSVFAIVSLRRRSTSPALIVGAVSAATICSRRVLCCARSARSCGRNPDQTARI